MRIFWVILFLALNALAETAVGDSANVVTNTDTANVVTNADTANVAASTDTASAVADTADPDTAVLERHSVPLPRLSAYTGYGLLVGLAFGLYNPTEECDCLGVWQGQFEYFYSDWISAGGDVRFFGGNLDADKSVLYQRYRINTRFHFPQGRWSWYVSPVVGFESTNLEEIREEWHQRDMEGWIPGVSTKNEQEVEDCEKMFSLDGFSIGVDLGGGIEFWNTLGATASILYEYNFGGAQLLTIAPGIAYNLQAVWPWSKKHLSAAWVSIETGFQRFFNRSVDSWAMSAYLGAVIGF